MIKQSTALVFVLIIFMYPMAHAEPGITDKVRALNSQSMLQLGLSLKELSILIEYSGKTVSEPYMKAIGSFSVFESLANKGFITIQQLPSTEGLESQKFFKVQPTSKGTQILHEL